MVRHSPRAGITLRFLALLAALVLGLIATLTFTDRVRATCTPEPASQWAPSGFVCDPIYGEGWASMWSGPGAARNDCTFPWTSCQALRITSLSNGWTLTVIPTMWCHCWVGVTGPNGETERLIDLDPTMVAALGLDPSKGLWRVKVTPVSEAGQSPSTLLPDTSMTANEAH